MYGRCLRRGRFMKNLQHYSETKKKKKKGIKKEIQMCLHGFTGKPAMIKYHY